MKYLVLLTLSLLLVCPCRKALASDPDFVLDKKQGKQNIRILKADEWCEEETLSEDAFDLKRGTPVIKVTATNLFILADRPSLRFKNSIAYALREPMQSPQDKAFQTILAQQEQQQKIEQAFISSSHKNNILSMPVKAKISFINHNYDKPGIF